MLWRRRTSYMYVNIFSTHSHHHTYKLKELEEGLVDRQWGLAEELAVLHVVSARFGSRERQGWYVFQNILHTLTVMIYSEDPSKAT